MVKSKVRAALQKIRRTLIGVFQGLKRIVSLKKNEKKPLKKRSVKEEKEKPSSKTPKPQKSSSQKKVVKSNKQNQKGRSKGRPKKVQP